MLRPQLDSLSVVLHPVQLWAIDRQSGQTLDMCHRNTSCYPWPQHLWQRKITKEKSRLFGNHNRSVLRRQLRTSRQGMFISKLACLPICYITKLIHYVGTDNAQVIQVIAPRWEAPVTADMLTVDTKSMYMELLRSCYT